MSNEQLINLMSGTVICTDEEGYACSLPAEDRKKIAEALEKQIPKKPLNEYEIDMCFSHSIEAECPRCASTVNKLTSAYCVVCGQKLNWSEAE